MNRDLSSAKILIVDDVVQNIQVLGSTLSKVGYDVFYAQSGEEALGVIEKEDLDLILLDVMMPGMTGFELSEKIHKDSGKAEIPIIFITALTEKSEVIKGFEAGGVDYITKPFNQWELLARVKSHLTLKFTQRELKEKNLVLEKTAADLLDAKREREKFFSILAHDLRNPFTSLLGLLDVVLADFDTFEPQDLYAMLENINGSGQNVYNLLLNLLAWGKAQKGGLVLEPKEITIRDLTEEILAVMGNHAEIKGISLLNRCGPQDRFWGDQPTMETVLRNLVSNGVKFTQEGGIVEVTSQMGENSLAIIVRDSGVGIPDKVLPNLFRLDEKHSTLGTNEERGTGLGLPLVKDYVQQNGGRIEVKSAVGKGTVFRVIVPIKP
jgi:two-component system sensor histidine kinase/response regulator